jgi:hypothetical protein
LIVHVPRRHSCQNCSGNIVTLATAAGIVLLGIG